MGLAIDLNQDTTIFDLYNTPLVMGNPINDRMLFIQYTGNLITVDVNDTYKYRPELLAKKYYGNESYFPIVLASNNIGTLFDFVPSKFNNTMKILDPKILQLILIG